MSEAMSWTKSSHQDRNGLFDAGARLVRAAVRWHLRQGAKDQAFAEAALDFGTTPRRVRSIYKNEIWTMAREEYDRLLRGWGNHLDRQMATLQREAEEIQARRAQLALDLDGKGNGAWHGGGTS